MKTEDLRGVNGRPLWEGHRARLRSRLDRDGWDALKPYEMVELVLCRVVPRKDLSNVARLLVDRFGSVGGVFSASREQLVRVPGVTQSMAEWITLTSDLIWAYRNLHGVPDVRLSCFQQVTDFLKPRLRQEEHPELWVLYADFCYNLIAVNDLLEDQAWWKVENARRMVIDAIGHGARFVYLVLWREKPFEGLSDVESARLDAISLMMRAAELDLVDCLLVNGDDVFSLRINGKMKEYGATAEERRLFERYGEPENDE